ncbi:MAG: host attachment protein [Novosphingobium sp.]
MLLPHGTIIALVDGQHLELYRNTGSAAEPHLAALPAPKLDERNHGSGGRHYSSAGNPDEHRQQEGRHAAGVAAWLNGEVLAQRIDKLVIMADPRTLGELRRHYPVLTERAALKDHATNLVGRPPERIPEALREHN